MLSLKMKPKIDRDLEFLVEKYARQLPRLSLPQVVQICQQITEHDYMEKMLTVKLASKDVILDCHRNVLQPMSSRHLAHFISNRQDIFEETLVYDIGTGTGIQAIAAVASGAKKVIASDLYDAPIANANVNIEKLRLSSVIKISQANLLDENVHKEQANVIIFAHPYFCDHPIHDYPVTTGMLDSGILVPKFLSDAKQFLKPGGSILSIHWPFAGQMNDPRTYLDRHPEYKLVETEEHRATFIQQGNVCVMRIVFKS